VRRIAVQNNVGLNLQRDSSVTKTEQVPLDTDPVPASRTTLQALRYLESKVTGAQGIEGVVLRYASFYGPDCSLSQGGEFVEQIKQRKLPPIGDRASVWSFLHYNDATYATVRAVDRARPAFTRSPTTTQHPESVRLPELAHILGAKPHGKCRPGSPSSWSASWASPCSRRFEAPTTRSTEQTFDWQPGYASWREGFRKGL